MPWPALFIDGHEDCGGIIIVSCVNLGDRSRNSSELQQAQPPCGTFLPNVPFDAVVLIRDDIIATKLPRSSVFAKASAVYHCFCAPASFRCDGSPYIWKEQIICLTSRRPGLEPACSRLVVGPFNQKAVQVENSIGVPIAQHPYGLQVTGSGGDSSSFVRALE